MTRPFEYLQLGSGQEKKLVLYARKECTDQLRLIHSVSVEIIERKPGHGTYTVSARAKTPDGRTDESSGVVSIEKEGGDWKTNDNGKRYFQGNGKWETLKGDALANCFMKAETKAKRRVTLSICGLGMLDESEIETIPDARRVQVEQQAAPTNPAIANGSAPDPAPTPPPPPEVKAAWVVFAGRMASTEKLLLKNPTYPEPGTLRQEVLNAASEKGWPRNGPCGPTRRLRRPPNGLAKSSTITTSVRPRRVSPLRRDFLPDGGIR